MSWERLGRVAPRELRGAREQAHQAVQLIAAAGQTFVAHAADTSHTAMTWDAARGALVGRELPGAEPCRVALRVADLTLLVLGPEPEPRARLELAGRALAEAYGAAAAALAAATRGAHDRPLVHPGFELPEHLLTQGGRFERDSGLPELARWYQNADTELTRLARETPGAGPVLCWPHHFDIATLIALEAGPDGGASRTVGAGVSPGDASIDEPYAYVTHWPTTRRRTLPALACGEWTSEGWTGAALRGSELAADADAAAQQHLLRSFLATAVAASRELACEAPLA